MIKLLNSKEFIVNPGSVKKATKDTYTLEGAETRGVIKQCTLSLSPEDFGMLKIALYKLGLAEYIELEHLEGEGVALRVVVEE